MLDGVQRFSLPSRTGNQLPERRHVVLLIEDNLADASLVREALSEHQVEGELFVVRDGETALRLFASFHTEFPCPSLIILDLNLPRISGHGVLEALRRGEACRDAPVAILSSSNTREDRAAATALGSNRYLHKPVTLQEFLSLGAIFKAMLEEP